VVRVPSLRGIGLTDQDLLDKGVLLLNLQMTGMLLGGVAFGVLGDKFGRVSVLFGSILTYSVANLANAFVHDIHTYALLRLIAGFGLAGELGAGITLVAETLPKEKRGIGTTIVASVGMIGALMAWGVAKTFDWRTAFIVGGVMGLALLLLRMGVFESGMFKNVCEKGVRRGEFFMLFNSRSRMRRFFGSVMMGVPLWFMVGVMITLSPEFAQVLNVQGLVEGGTSVFYCYSGLVFGDMCSGLLSQYLRSRKKSIAFSLILFAIGMAYFFLRRGESVGEFYALCFFLGFSCGYWAMFATVAAEQFGTNMRATVATCTPNFVRGSLVPVSAAFMALKSDLGILNSGMVIGACVMTLGFLGLYMIDESYGKSMEFEER
jgi:predicted MFS family arabinose efflux permease